MALMFQATSRLKRAVQLINSLEKAKFPLLLSRIIQKLHLRDDRAFSEEEEEKLQIALGLESDDLHIVLETCAFILEQIQALVELWTSNGKPVVEKLKQRSLAPKQLQAVNWRLNLQMAQSNMAKMKLPNALFELRVSSGSQGVKDNIYLEFTHEELYSFYNQLETIQSQLDSLRS
ncbi:COMM domain-containing protein 10-like isoform X2 [Montipora capricornis]|uniref:COMM domain-containing protein 10-like isoform X2 n=1 Tax=Montipora capricornis TaxID=246305 RepID=UPI0035F1D86A